MTAMGAKQTPEWLATCCRKLGGWRLEGNDENDG